MCVAYCRYSVVNFKNLVLTAYQANLGASGSAGAIRRLAPLYCLATFWGLRFLGNYAIKEDRLMAGKNEKERLMNCKHVNQLYAPHADRLRRNAAAAQVKSR
jgi:hypothetical protein